MKLSHCISALVIAITLASCGSGDQSEDTTNENHTDTASASVEKQTPQPTEPAVDTKKQELLASLVGEYPLDKVDGFTGANTMYEYYILENEWVAFGSSNNGGVREGYTIDLTDQDIQRLQTAKIIVGEDLSVAYECDGKTYFDVQFKADGMEYSMNKPSSEYYSALPEGVDENTTFFNNILFLLAQEVPQEEVMQEIDILQVMADAVVIRYSEADTAFEMSLFYGDCCDNSIYTFKK